MSDPRNELPPSGGRRAAIQAELAQLAAQAAADASDGPSYDSAGLRAPEWMPPAPVPAASEPPVPAAAPLVPPAVPVAPTPSWDEIIAEAVASASDPEPAVLTAPAAPVLPEPPVVEPSAPASSAPASSAPASSAFEPWAFEAPEAVPAFVPAPAPAAAAPADPVPGRADADPELIAALQEVLATGASDLHITANSTPMLRIDGALRPAPGTRVWDRDRVRAALYTLLTPQQRAAFEQELELDFAYTVSANARFRVNYYQQRDAIGAAFRIIPTEIRDLGSLGVPETVGRFAGLPRGLVLVTGPTGSGKSTTLAALIDLVNSTRADHIVTVEDPIEFLHNHKKSIVNQREVGHDTHSFANALKHVLRQDPDVILVGELRDLETISVALTAAETGHLVFATLHTQDAAQTIDRVIDVFPPHQQDQVRTQLASTLQGVVCQTLVKRADGEGRVVATEVLVTTPAVGNLIREGKTYQIASAMQAGRELGMHTMDQHLAELVNTGKITREAALEKCHDPAGFDRLIHRSESPTDAVSRAFQAHGPDFGDAFSRIGR